MSIEAVSFDFWHTLFTEQPGAFKLYKERRRSLLAEAVLSCRQVNQAELEQACHLEAVSHNELWRQEHRTSPAAERVGKILAHLDVCLSDEQIAELSRRFEEGILEHPPVLVRGARECVKGLASRYRLGIISDVGFSPGRVLKQVLAQNDLLGLFDSLVFSDEAGRSKPHIEVFSQTARNLSVDPRALVHVGDLEYTDVVGAKRAGSRVIRFSGVTPIEEGEDTLADLVTDDLTEIPALVETLSRSELAWSAK